MKPVRLCSIAVAVGFLLAVCLPAALAQKAKPAGKPAPRPTFSDILKGARDQNAINAEAMRMNIKAPITRWGRSDPAGQWPDGRPALRRGIVDQALAGPWRPVGRAPRRGGAGKRLQLPSLARIEKCRQLDRGESDFRQRLSPTHADQASRRAVRAGPGRFTENKQFLTGDGPGDRPGGTRRKGGVGFLFGHRTVGTDQLSRSTPKKLGTHRPCHPAKQIGLSPRAKWPGERLGAGSCSPRRAG